MKNFPEEDAFHELEKRLQNYSELPDDAVWKNIDSALRPTRRWIFFPWLDAATVLVLVAAGLFAFNISGNQFLQERLSNAVEKDMRNQKPRAEGELPSQSNGEEKNNLKIEVKRSVTNMSGNDDVLDNSNASQRIQHPNLYQANGLNQNIAVIDTTSLADSASRSTLTHAVQKLDSLSPMAIEKATTDSIKQADDTKESKQLRKRKHTFYAMLTPSLSFQQADPVGRDGIVVTGFQNTSILSADRFGFSINAGVQGFISKRFEYYGGLSFYHQHQTIKYEYQSPNEVIVEESADKRYNVSPKSAVGTVNYKMLNVGVDAGFLFHLYGKALTHKVGAGLTYQQGLNNSSSEEYTNSRSTYLSYQLFYRNELRLNARLRFFVQPTFVQSIVVKEKLNAPFNVKPYRAGLGFGILYCF